mmetsp:Transcript_146983/g.471867  ORF Transcript_146983/g.471867 Transcript_146983/m.471867 type:complete len:246 (-) Transcript_146983:1727-2464(-)
MATQAISPSPLETFEAQQDPACRRPSIGAAVAVAERQLWTCVHQRCCRQKVRRAASPLLAQASSAMEATLLSLLRQRPLLAPKHHSGQLLAHPLAPVASSAMEAEVLPRLRQHLLLAPRGRTAQPLAHPPTPGRHCLHHCRSPQETPTTRAPQHPSVVAPPAAQVPTLPATVPDLRRICRPASSKPELPAQTDYGTRTPPSRNLAPPPSHEQTPAFWKSDPACPSEVRHWPPEMLSACGLAPTCL